MRRRRSRFALALAAFAAAGAARAGEPAIAMRGEPALAPGFAALPYANPDAPKGGRLRLCPLGAFDSLNPFNPKALSTADGLIDHVFEPLMARSRDEPFTLYGLIAERLETDAARDFATFRLNPAAHFSDGSPLTADDVRFTFELLREQGRPQMRAAFARVRSVETPDTRTIRFDLAGAGDRELPLLIGIMPVLSRRATDAAGFADPSLKIPIGSGPYVVENVDPGRRLTLKRDPRYWGAALPVNRGRFNFDRIDVIYFRDDTSRFAALESGLCDLRIEDDATRWRTGYDFPARLRGEVRQEAFPIRIPRGLSGLVFNTRRPIFADVRVREALAGMLDFGWINATLFGGAYARDESFFGDSPLSSAGKPADAAERALLAPYPGLVREDILEGRWRPPPGDGTGRDRAAAARALAELRAAGWTLRDGALRDARGDPLGFEILVKSRSEERLALLYANMLARIGATARVRLVDESEFQRRRGGFDFDMIPASFAASASPGAEQRGRWGSSAADMEGAYNVAGVRLGGVDALIEAMLAAGDEAGFEAAARALDRALLSGFYVVPYFHAKALWVASSAALAHPERAPRLGPDFDAWWRSPGH